jgi:outer membrane lipoprotein carrier protein
VSTPRAHTRWPGPSGLAAALLALSALAAPAATGTALDQFLENLQSLRASFTQVVLDAKGQQLESGQGTLLVRRPGRFRWEYTPEGEGPQLLVADGTNLWFYDRDLQQATVKPASAALTTTPVILLSGTAEEMRAAFTISEQGSHDGLEWVQVAPRSAAAEFSSAELGFSGAQLLRLVIHDRLNQTETLKFTRTVRGAHIEDSELRFTPPPGVDVIGTPQLIGTQ